MDSLCKQSLILPQALRRLCGGQGPARQAGPIGHPKLFSVGWDESSSPTSIFKASASINLFVASYLNGPCNLVYRRILYMSGSAGFVSFHLPHTPLPTRCRCLPVFVAIPTCFLPLIH